MVSKATFQEGRADPAETSPLCWPGMDPPEVPMLGGTGCLAAPLGVSLVWDKNGLFW